MKGVVMKYTYKAAVLGTLLLGAPLAQAATLAIDGSSPGIKQSVDSPCIISAINCPGQPAGFSFTNYASGGVSDIDLNSPTYTVDQLLNAVGLAFSVALDVNQTNANSPQTLNLFEMFINNVLVDSYTGSIGNVPVINNGTGDADYLLYGFTSLAGLALTDTVYFHAVMSDLNDGPEQIFLVPAAVPVPAAGFMLLGAIGGLVALRRKKKSV